MLAKGVNFLDICNDHIYIKLVSLNVKNVHILMLFLSHFSIGLVKFYYLWHTLMKVSIRLFMFLHFYALAWHYTVYIILHLFSIDNFEIKYCSYINIHQEKER